MNMMRKHIELTADEAEFVKRHIKVTQKMTLIKVVNNTLQAVKDKIGNPNEYDYCSRPSVCHVKPYYILWGGNIAGKIEVNVRNDIITFKHGNKDYSYSWNEMKNNTSYLSSLIKSYATSYNLFEQMVKDEI